MKTYLFLSLSLLFALNVSAQQDTGFTNRGEAMNKTIKGLKEGKWVEFSTVSLTISSDSSNAQYYVLDTYKGGKINGVVHMYHRNNGAPFGRMTYKDGEKNGPVKQYYPNGTIYMEGNFLNDKPDGTIKIYASRGQLEEEQNYADGKRNGEQKTYHENGKLRSIATFVNGEENGLAKTYYDDGKLWTETTYTNGVKGNKKEYTYDKNGKPVDEAKMHEEDSIRMAEAMQKTRDELRHRLDSENLPLKKYDSGFTNKAEAKNLIVDGKREGKWIVYVDNQGKATTDSSSAIFYDLVIYHNSNPCGMMHGYYKNGNPVSRLYYEDGNKMGKEVLYWENGNVMEVRYFDYNVLQGTSKAYWENGKLRVEKNYVEGEEEGIEKTYDETGKLKSETTYSKGTATSVKNY